MLMKYRDFKSLSKDDMKQILGGYAPPIVCTITLNTTLAQCNGLSTSWTCPVNDANQCQDGADNFCKNGNQQDCCNDIDCPGAAA